MKKALNDNKLIRALVIAMAITVSSIAQNKQDSALIADKQKLRIELSKTNVNHQLLVQLVGDWTFEGQHTPVDTTRRPTETFGTFTRKGIWEKQNRYFITETTSGKKIPMPWADWKDMTYYDLGIEGYDNVKKKFFFIIVANHWNTGYLVGEGTYDATTKTFTYEFDLKPEAGTIIKVVRKTKINDADHYREESVSSIAGREIQRSEVNYTRVKSDQ